MLKIEAARQSVPRMLPNQGSGHLDANGVAERVHDGKVRVVIPRLRAHTAQSESERIVSLVCVLESERVGPHRYKRGLSTCEPPTHVQHTS